MGRVDAAAVVQRGERALAEDRDGELAVLGRMIEACRAQADALDMPGLSYLLAKAATSPSFHAAAGALPDHLATGAAIPPEALRRAVRS